MSGIVGICDLNGGAVDRSLLQRMVRKTAHRGPDQSAIWVDGPIGMGHCLLRTTPESVGERQPFLSVDGTCCISCHARLDNRPELIQGLALPHLRSAPDVGLILAAYQRWGTGCLSHLVGDFAFAIWDARDWRLFCARDRMGICPFHYHFNGQQFVWASEIGPLFEDRRIPRVIDDGTVVDALIGKFTRPTETFYRGIHRLAGAHHLVLTRDGGLRVERYWEPASGMRRKRLKREVVDDFLSLYQEVVRSHLRSLSPVGVWMSGGIDSTSVVAMAQRVYHQDGLQDRSVLPVCAVFDELSSVDERPWMQPLLEQYQLQMYPVLADSLYSFSERQPEVHAAAEEPLGPERTEVVYGLMRKSHDLGLRVVLTGHPADVVLEGNPMYLVDMFVRGQWAALAREFTRCPKLWRWRREVARKWLRAIYRSTLSPLLSQAGIQRVAFSPPWLADSVLRRTSAGDRAHPAQGPGRSQSYAAQEEYEGLMEVVQSNRITWLQNAALQHGIELRHPFCDARLVEFLFSVPVELKMENAVPKSLLRDAMAGLLPDNIRLPGKDRGNFDFVLDRGLQEVLRGDWRAWLGRGLLVTLGYVNQAGIEHLVHQYLNGDHAKRHQVGRVVQVETWLRRSLDAPDDKREMISGHKAA